MKTVLLLAAVALMCFSCTKNGKDNLPQSKFLYIQSSSTDLPLNEYGQAILNASDEAQNNMTDYTIFYVNGNPIPGNIFKPETTGIYQVKGVYNHIESGNIELRVEAPLNKKVLLEYYTAVGCGWCPWMGYRVDSLHKNNTQVIGYSLHGDDYLEAPGLQEIQVHQTVEMRPAVRVDRGYVRDFYESYEITGLLDSIRQFLSVQPPLEISVSTSLNNNALAIDIKGKVYRDLTPDLYVTCVLVEDKVMSHNQSNNFSGRPNYTHCPFTELSDPIPDYENHNLLRKFVSGYFGDPIQLNTLHTGQEGDIASYSTLLENVTIPDNCWVIVLVHGYSGNYEKSSVLNAQIVQAGKSAGFKE